MVKLCDTSHLRVTMTQWSTTKREKLPNGTKTKTFHVNKWKIHITMILLICLGFYFSNAIVVSFFFPFHCVLFSKTRSLENVSLFDPLKFKPSLLREMEYNAERMTRVFFSPPFASFVRYLDMFV